MSEIKIISASCQGHHDFKKKTCYISTVNKNVIYYVYKILTLLRIWKVTFVMNRAMMFTSTRTFLIQGGLLSSLIMISNLLYIKTLLMTRVIS